jgi:hypothetical protein
MRYFKCTTNEKAPITGLEHQMDIDGFLAHPDYLECTADGEYIRAPKSDQREPWEFPVRAPTGDAPVKSKAPKRKGK